MEDYLNHTTAYVPPTPQTKDYRGYYIFIFIVLVTLGAVAMLIYFKRKQSDELRHRLIPMYTYDPAEQDDDDDLNNSTENEGVKELLHKYGRLSVDSDYGTDK